jgi:hypothetical protein
MSQVQIDFAKKITEEAIQAGVDHANAIHECWSDVAFDFFKGYAEINPRFMTEDVRMASKGLVPEPPTARAWGWIALKAAKAGIVHNKNRETDKVKNIRAHHANAAVWKSLIVKQRSR